MTFFNLSGFLGRTTRPSRRQRRSGAAAPSASSRPT